MNIQLTDPVYTLLLPASMVWLLWWFRRSDVQIGRARRWVSLFLRCGIVTALVLALAGLQWNRPREGMNVFFLLDRSDSVPSPQQEAARSYVNRATQSKEENDRAGVLVFGAQAALESTASRQVNLDQEKVLAVVDTERTDLASAIRLGTAAFPDTGQKRMVLVSDGNENLGDAVTALLSAKSLGVSLDVIPLGADRDGDVAMERIGLPGRVPEGATFECRVFVESDRARRGTLRLYRNDEVLGEEEVELKTGKNLFKFPQQLSEPGFYRYGAVLESDGDTLPQNNQASGFVQVRGEPRLLVVSASPPEDQALVAALSDSGLRVDHAGLGRLPRTLAEMTSYDAIFISNLAAGDLGEPVMNLLESAVRDFGVGLVCVGGDQAYAAGGYRNTPLETALPVSMELDSKKVLPNGAMVLVMHGMEFNNGNQIARDCALGVLDALGPQDELGVAFWDGQERWLFELTKVGDKQELGRQIAGMNQGDLISFQNILSMAHQALNRSTANLKHIVVFSDGDPGAPTQDLLNQIVGDRITVSTVLIAGHAGPDTMEWIAAQGRGRFYDVNNPANLPQIFVKEAAVILKAAIFEEPFTPQLVLSTELTRGFEPGQFPALLGYVSATAKPRAEVPIVSEKGDPILAHWQFGLGRAAAFTSDAKARWARTWLDWPNYQQFWTQIARWSLRRLDTANFGTDVTIEEGAGQVVVEALDPAGRYRNFLNLQAIVLDPDGKRQIVPLEQTGPGRYEAAFPTREVGAYLLNLQELDNGQIVGSEVVGTSVNYSPEFRDTSPNLNLLKRLAELGGGRVLDASNPEDNPFRHDRLKTFQPLDLWQWLLRCALILFVADVGVRRVQLDPEQWRKAATRITRLLLFWKAQPRPTAPDESLAALLARRDQVRTERAASSGEPIRPDLFKPREGAEAASPLVAVHPELEQARSSAAQEEKSHAPEDASPTSRLLEAKRRARKKME